MEQKIALVTGANSGLGKAVALGLAKMNYNVVLVCRDQQRGEQAQTDIIATSGNPSVDLLLADLCSQASIHQLVGTFQSKYSHLHLLINNAGVSLGQRRETADGIEYCLAVNHLAPFLLTNLLLDTLKASAPARIVNVGTRINTEMDFDDLQFKQRPYNNFRAYAQTKLGNIHFTYELARRLAGTGVTVNCVHPGVFQSNLGGESESFFWFLVSRVGRLLLPTADKAAGRVLYLATSAEVEGVSGRYFADKKEIPSPPQTNDPAANHRLWQISAELTGLAV